MAAIDRNALNVNASLEFAVLSGQIEPASPTFDLERRLELPGRDCTRHIAQMGQSILGSRRCDCIDQVSNCFVAFLVRIALKTRVLQVRGAVDVLCPQMAQPP